MCSLYVGNIVFGTREIVWDVLDEIDTALCFYACLSSDGPSDMLQRIVVLANATALITHPEVGAYCGRFIGSLFALADSYRPIFALTVIHLCLPYIRKVFFFLVIIIHI